MSYPRTLLPVDDLYQARVLVGYLAEGFAPLTGRTRDVPPAESPLYPLACRVIEAMGRDNYRIAAFAVEGRYGARTGTGAPVRRRADVHT